jgi:hypothetical protein
MKQATVRLSFDIPVKEHIDLKSECVKARIPIKDFLHEWMLKGLQELKKQQFHESIIESFHQAYEGKVHELDIERFKEFADE